MHNLHHRHIFLKLFLTIHLIKTHTHTDTQTGKYGSEIMFSEDDLIQKSVVTETNYSISKF